MANLPEEQKERKLLPTLLHSPTVISSDFYSALGNFIVCGSTFSLDFPSLVLQAALICNSRLKGSPEVGVFNCYGWLEMQPGIYSEWLKNA